LFKHKASTSNLVTNKHHTKVEKTPEDATGKNPKNNYLLKPQLERQLEERQYTRWPWGKNLWLEQWMYSP